MEHNEIQDKIRNSDAVNELVETLCKRYFFKNFGSLSKSELDVLMFHCYLKTFPDKAIPSDFSISVQLGITQSRVRTLKEKEYLLYSRKNDDGWKEEFKKILSENYIQFEKTNNKVNILIQDINLLSEIRNFIESNRMFDEVTSNRHLLSCPMETFAELCVMIDQNEAVPSFKKLKIEDIITTINPDIKKKIIAKIGEITGKTLNEVVSDLIKKKSKDILHELLSQANLGGALAQFMNIIISNIS